MDQSQDSSLLKQLTQQKNDYIAQKDWQAALAVLDQMLAIQVRPELLHQKGIFLFQLQQYQDAKSQFEQVLATSPDFTRAKEWLIKVESYLNLEAGDITAVLTGDGGRTQIAAAQTVKQNPSSATQRTQIAAAQTVKQNPLLATQQTIVAETPAAEQNPLLATQQTIVAAQTAEPNQSLASQNTFLEQQTCLAAGHENTGAAGEQRVKSWEAPKTANFSLGQVLDQEREHLEKLLDDNPKSYGRYQIFQELGRGGMGKVYRAHDTVLKREVALKTMLSGNDQQLEQRFIKEAESMAKLSHVNIVKVYDIGVAGTTQYFTMELIAGTNLSQLVKESKLTTRRAVEVLRKVSEAIDYAHQHGILHRDIKPSNVMLDEHNEPKVMDFGLAMDMEQDSRLSKSGMVIGTPAYMPPEQALGKRREIDERSDVYSLGAVLYELLTGVPPFRGSNAQIILNQVLNQEPVPPSQVSAKIPRELEKICLKAMAKERRLRYQSAHALAADLGRFLAGEPVMAINPGLRYKLVKWLARNPQVAMVAMIVVILVALAGMGFIWQIHAERMLALDERDRANNQARQTEIALNIANDERQKAELARQQELSSQKETLRQKIKAVKNLVTSYIERGDDLWSDGYLQKACLLYGQAVMEEADDQIPRALTLPARLRLCYRFPITSGFIIHQTCKLPPCQGGIKLDDKRQSAILVTEDRTNDQNRARIDRFDLIKTNVKTTLFDGDFKVHGCAISLASNLAALGKESGEIVVVDCATQKVVKTFQALPSLITAIDFNPDGTLMAAGSNNGMLRIWNPQTAEVKAEFNRFKDGRTSQDKITALTFSNDGRRVAIAIENGQIWLWDWAENVKQSVHSKFDIIHAIAFSPDGKNLALGSDDGIVHLWDISQKGNQFFGSLRGHFMSVSSLCFSHDSKLLASGSEDKTIRIWDLQTGYVQQVLQGHTQEVVALAFNEDCRMLFSSSSDKTIRSWDIKQAAGCSVLRWLTDDVETVAFSPDGKKLVAGGVGKTIQIWERQEPSSDQEYWPTIKPPKLPPVFTGKITAVAYSPDGTILAIGGHERAVHLLNSHTRKHIGDGILHQQERVNAIAFSPDSRLLAVALYKEPATLWDVQRQTLLTTFSDHFRCSWAVAFSPDGKLLAFSINESVLLVGVAHQTLVGTLPNVNCAQSLAFSPNSKIVAAGNRDGTVTVWDLVGKELTKRNWVGHVDEVRSVAFSPDGQVLASGSWDQTINFWQTGSWELCAKLRGNSGGVNGLAFRPDGKILACGNQDNNVRLWSTAADMQFLSLTTLQIKETIEARTGLSLASEKK